MAESVTRPRRLAFEALRAVRAGDFADRAAQRLLAPLEPRDRAWAVELLYGTLRLRGRLDHMLGARLKGKLNALEPDVLDVLRLGAFQLVEMGSVPPYAALSQSQELARAVGAPRAARLVAGVLHALQRSPDVEFPDREREPERFLATWGSHPEWLVRRWIGRWGPDAAEALVEANNLRPELYLRPVGVPAIDAAERLRAAGIDADRSAISSRSLRLPASTSVHDAFAVLPSIVQDPAASLVVEYASVPPGVRVIDVCAAPGGKAIAMAEHARFVAAADLSAGRLSLVRDNARRVGLSDRISLLVADGRTAPFHPGSADLVLLDAPCTGTGTFRRHPDGRWRLRPDNLEQLAGLQMELIESAALLVAPGGTLVYATCSLELEENDMQIQRFLRQHRDWVVEPIDGAVPDGLVGSDGALRVLPHRHGVDGSFAVRMRRGS